MCLGTFLRLRRSLATSTLYAAVRIPAERFLCNGNEISHYTQKSCRPRRQPCFALYDFFVVRSGKIKYKLRLCLILFLTTKPRPVKGRGNISETTCYCILTYDLYAPVVTRRIRQNLLIFDLSACNSEVIFNHLLLAPVLHRHRLALPFTNDLLSSS